MADLKDDVKYLKGVGPKLALILEKLSINKAEDLVYHFPRRYEDRSNFFKISDLSHGDVASVFGKVVSCENRKAKNNNKFVITTVTITDDTGYINLVWFNQIYKKAEFDKLIGKNIIAFGQVSYDGWKFSISNPEYEIDDEEEVKKSRIIPVYNLTEGINQNLMRKIVQNAVKETLGQIKENLPEYIQKERELMSKQDAIFNIHFPESLEAFENARKRLAFEELFILQLALLARKREISMPGKGIKFELKDDFFKEFSSKLPFQLTNAQKKVIREIAFDMSKPDSMNRLLQGDVGSGKTVVAVAAMLLAVQNGYQSAIMAPTEILADQHFITISKFLKSLNIDIQINLLKGSLRAKEKREVTAKIASGETQIIIGTHALTSQNVEFKNLGLVIIDEQHRFGVAQRATLFSKGENPDVLFMTATPIPRTLTMAVYGDLNLSVIDELPPNRKPIITHWKQNSQRERVYESLKDLIKQGKQAYIVCPLIEESEKLQVQAATELFCFLKEQIFPELRIAVLHGQMKTNEKDSIMQDFRDHKLDILVATSVIEVGIDVPNANCIIIEDSDRFGLSQLHQLRGRVGRGSEKSFCVLISNAKSEDAKTRMKVMENTNNGFVIAEEDLKLRGPGELSGTRQSGIADFKIADIFKDILLLEEARESAQNLLEKDPFLITDDTKNLKNEVILKLSALSNA